MKKLENIYNAPKQSEPSPEYHGDDDLLIIGDPAKKVTVKCPHCSQPVFLGALEEAKKAGEKTYECEHCKGIIDITEEAN